ALLSRDLLSLLRTARGVARQRARLSEEEERRVERWLAALASALEGTDPASMQALREELAQVAVEPQWSNDQRYLLT
ncbi:hypothetical protein, partial [Salmonella sp. SAL04284]